MKNIAGLLRLAATDLSNHLGCRHLTNLDLATATRLRPAPAWRSPDAAVLQQRGQEHEDAYLRHLALAGHNVLDLREPGGGALGATGENELDSLRRTLAAMAQGVDCIAQATLAHQHWFGRADLLRRVATPSALGPWSYEVYDCKLASETKAGTILQLSLYSDLLSRAQGLPPANMYVVTPGTDFVPETYRVLDYAAYFRSVQASLEASLHLARFDDTGTPSNSYPEPVPQCDSCRWFLDCDTRRRRDDHLSLVAGLSRAHNKQLASWDVTTVESLSRLPLPVPYRPESGSKSAYNRLREQARVQVAGRTRKLHVHELLDFFPEHGLLLLPEPSPGDVFFDLEGDPFIGTDGLEYLFGFSILQPDGTCVYQSRWAFTAEQEKAAFQWFVDSVLDLKSRHPEMHIYHFGHYEPSALKRLMVRYATRQDEVDRFLRGKWMVDLHTAAKRSIRASVEQYSLKALEPFHGFVRILPLESARPAIRILQRTLELAQPLAGTETCQSDVQAYNADDCLSTKSLRDWLERERHTLVAGGTGVPRPQAISDAPGDELAESRKLTAELSERLKFGVPADPKLRSPEQSARWLLASLLEWHRRENNVDCWDFHRLAELTAEELFDDKSGISGLRRIERFQEGKKLPVDRYGFDPQDFSVRPKAKLCAGLTKMGDVRGVNAIEGWIDVGKTGESRDLHPNAVFVDPRSYGDSVLSDALFLLGSWIDEHGIASPGPHRAARDLLLRHPPRLTDGQALRLERESSTESAVRIVSRLDESVLPIQGPPGAGKTYTGAKMILEAIRGGKKVGVTANSHKVIQNLLENVVSAALPADTTGLRCMQKVSILPDPAPHHVGWREASPTTGAIELVTDNKKARTALDQGVNVLGGTAWLWASEQFTDSVDILFVDEAGQMALANVLAASAAAKSIVLLGDPQQLEQPTRANHPDGAGVSALEHLLDGHPTIQPHQGLFLEHTWRLHPSICAFTSEVFYENRLQSRPGLEHQRSDGHPWLGNAGLWFIPVQHHGNQTSAPEEVARVAGLVQELLSGTVHWVDDKSVRTPLRPSDILVVAPYNAQVNALAAELNSVPVGTVDRFQGQQAPVVIYSLTASSPEDAPRGMDFLYNLSRLNVATSRAKGIVILLGSPLLLQPECKSPHQMKLANALCRYAELAQTTGSAVQTA